MQDSMTVAELLGAVTKYQGICLEGGVGEAYEKLEERLMVTHRGAQARRESLASSESISGGSTYVSPVPGGDGQQPNRFLNPDKPPSFLRRLPS
jgi:hypothetical protein